VNSDMPEYKPLKEVEREPEERCCNVCQNVTRAVPQYYPSTATHGCWAITCNYCGKKLITQTV